MTVTAQASDLVFDPYDPETAMNPYSLARRLRDEAPLYHDEKDRFYLLSRYDDIQQAHIDRESLISGRGVTLGTLMANVHWPPGTVVMEDDPTHAIHRALLSRMFTPKRISELEPRVRRLCADILDPLVGMDQFDFVAEVSKAVPMRVIGMLVGIPEQDQASIRDTFADYRTRDADDRAGVLSGEMFVDYINWRAEHPSDDIMTKLLHTEFEDETGTSRTLTREELMAYVSIVSAAGNETTRNWISWTAKLLGENPDQRRLLVEDASLIPNAVEEALRCETPSTLTCRYVARDVEFHGQVVPEGSILAMLIPSANRDERQYPDPETFDVRRPVGTFMTFGFGSHYCLGQALARLEGRALFDEVLKRFPDWEVDMSAARFNHDDTEVRGWDSLPVAILPS